MVHRRRSQADDVPSAGILTTEPQLVPPSYYNSRHKLDVYDAVDYLGTRFHVGDHVAMNTNEGKEWVCVLELFYCDPDTSETMFKGLWFWSVEDVRQTENDVTKVMRPSKCESHELLASDLRDINSVVTINRKCHILSYDNFELVRKVVIKPGSQWTKTYFCERQYYHKANRFSELNSVFFPGDPIPRELRVAAGLPESPPVQLEDEQPENSYREPVASAPTRRSARIEEAKNSDSLNGEPLSVW